MNIAIYVLSLIGAFLVLILILVGWELRYALQRGKMWIVTLGIDRKFSWHFVKVQGKQVQVGKFLYNIVPDTIIRTGRWNIPTAYYLENNKDPLQLNKVEVKTVKELSAQDEADARETHIARDILYSLNSSPQQIMMTFAIIVCVVMLLSVGYLQFQMSREFKKLQPATIEQVSTNAH